MLFVGILCWSASVHTPQHQLGGFHSYRRAPHAYDAWLATTAAKRSTLTTHTRGCLGESEEILCYTPTTHMCDVCEQQSKEQIARSSEKVSPSGEALPKGSTPNVFPALRVATTSSLTVGARVSHMQTCPLTMLEHVYLSKFCQNRQLLCSSLRTLSHQQRTGRTLVFLMLQSQSTRIRQVEKK